MEKEKNYSGLLDSAVSSLAERIAGILRGRRVADEHARLITEDKRVVDKIIAATLESTEYMKRTFIVPVNFNMRIEDLLKLGNYDLFDEKITNETFQTKFTGKVERKITLIPFHPNFSFNEALTELDKMEYRPAEAHEVLSFGAKYLDIQRVIKIVALGSASRDSRDPWVVCLQGYGTWREVVIVRFASVYLGNWYCAAVHR